MAIRPIALYPEPVLLVATRPVAEVDQELCDFVGDMVETMYAAPGIGLAANQVGDSRRVCVVDLSVGENPEELLVLINPVVLDRFGPPEVAEEGCLSFPDILVDINRTAQVRVEALDLEGRSRIVEADGLLARAIQHECEHLDGQTFLSSLSPLKRELVKKQIRKRIKNGDWEEATTK
jgi:peptide deformylase